MVNTFEEQVEEDGITVGDNSVHVFNVGFGKLGFGENAVKDCTVELSVFIGFWNG